MRTECDVCKSSGLSSLYQAERIPVFLNKLFLSKDAALNSPAAKVNIVGCTRCGYVFNASFQDALMDYNDDYIQSQGHSASFKDYTESILNFFIKDLDVKTDTILEIGCGKEAYFLNMLVERGINIVGVDPLYAGKNPHIVKGYFNRDTAKKLQANVVVIRHTLELLEHPLQLIQDLKLNMPANATIYIEAPRYEWIVQNNAFWDLSHEIRSYFSENFFHNVFSGKATIYRTFADQYMIIKARLDDLNATLAEADTRTVYSESFASSISHYRKALHNQKVNYVWGAGAKGSAFVNLLDPDAKLVTAVIDINPEKQGRFMPLTGHPCIAPQSVPWKSLGGNACLWIMNENYKTEILSSIPEYKDGDVIVLGQQHGAKKAA